MKSTVFWCGFVLYALSWGGVLALIQEGQRAAFSVAFTCGTIGVWLMLALIGKK